MHERWKCKKRFPEQFLLHTQHDGEGYPNCRRRSEEDGGNTFDIQLRGNKFTVDNRWIVPYCPLLSKIFKAHINVEFCNSVSSIKYICKYINKGTYMSMVALEDQNEINEVSNYKLTWYIGSNEAAWWILRFDLHQLYHAVIHLDIHLENGQGVYFKENNIQQHIENPNLTKLTAYFKLNEEDVFARTLLYENIPSYYTWRNKYCFKF